MKAKKALSLLLVITMLLVAIPAVSVSADNETGFWDLRNKENVSAVEMAITLDGEAMNITHYRGHYYSPEEPNQLTFGIPEFGASPQGLRDDLQINIYVPDNASDSSAVLFLLNISLKSLV